MNSSDKPAAAEGSPERDPRTRADSPSKETPDSAGTRSPAEPEFRILFIPKLPPGFLRPARKEE